MPASLGTLGTCAASMSAAAAIRLGGDSAQRRAQPMSRGRVYLVPNLLGVVPPADVLPSRTIQIARSLANWAVETPKPARAFLKSLAPERPIAQMSITPIGAAPDRRSVDALLGPVLGGEDIGVLSDAGCPGVADPGAIIVAAAHAHGLQVVPLVGPSSLLLALMASGMNGQRFMFHGYLPARPDDRAAALRQIEAASRAQRCTQLFIETPYRNVDMLTTIVDTLASSTRLCVAVDLTLPSESVCARTIREWRAADVAGYAKRPAMFLIEASAPLRRSLKRRRVHAHAVLVHHLPAEPTGNHEEPKGYGR